MNQEALEYLRNSGSDFKVVLDQPDSVTIAINGATQEIDKTVATRKHQFKTLGGFMDYLNSGHCKSDNGVVFVGSGVVLADLQYQVPGAEHTAALQLEFSEEYNALQKLFKGVGQRELWRLLITSLDGCLPPDLLLQVGSIKIEDSKNVNSKIQNSGLSEKATSAVMKMSTVDGKGNPQQYEIGLDWLWNGRIWEALDHQFGIPIRLELDVEGPKFTFHPRRLETILRDARMLLISELTKGLSGTEGRFTVHEGQL